MAELPVNITILCFDEESLKFASVMFLGDDGANWNDPAKCSDLKAAFDYVGICGITDLFRLTREDINSLTMPLVDGRHIPLPFAARRLLILLMAMLKDVSRELRYTIDIATVSPAFFNEYCSEKRKNITPQILHLSRVELC